ncbi:MAG: hypothetical protein JNK76_19925, partial [Planctomycetales bacterium]|nr:hypothetical protein [Planctomycetales bacterium]
QKLKQVAWMKLPDMRTDFKEMQRMVADMQAKLAATGSIAKPSEGQAAA